MTTLVVDKIVETFLDGILFVKAIEPIGVYMFSVFRPWFFLNIYFALQDFDDRKIELLGKLPVPFIMGRNSHDGSCSVGNENIVCNPDRKLMSVYRVDGIGT